MDHSTHTLISDEVYAVGRDVAKGLVVPPGVVRRPRRATHAAKAYAETIEKALDQKTQEAESLRAECERLKAQEAQKQ